QNWRLERMAIVERNVIRIALFELKYVESVPVNVVLNEAVELAKRYGTAEGAAFTNGLLDRAVGELGVRREAAPVHPLATHIASSVSLWSTGSPSQGHRFTSGSSSGANEWIRPGGTSGTRSISRPRASSA